MKDEGLGPAVRGSEGGLPAAQARQSTFILHPSSFILHPKRSFIPSRALSPAGLVGAVVLVVLLLVALFAGQVSPYDPIKQDFRVEREAPGGAHLLGTDEFGRDLLSRVIWGARVSLQAGAIAASLA